MKTCKCGKPLYEGCHADGSSNCLSIEFGVEQVVKMRRVSIALDRAPASPEREFFRGEFQAGTLAGAVNNNPAAAARVLGPALVLVI
jgi:hypothetical protein